MYKWGDENNGSDDDIGECKCVHGIVVLDNGHRVEDGFDPPLAHGGLVHGAGGAGGVDFPFPEASLLLVDEGIGHVTKHNGQQGPARAMDDRKQDAQDQEEDVQARGIPELKGNHSLT